MTRHYREIPMGSLYKHYKLMPADKVRLPHPNTKEFPCGNCGRVLRVTKYHWQRYKNFYCDKKCERKKRAPKKNEELNGGGVSNGYWYVTVEGIRRAVHRIVMERKIGRKLHSDEHVHHLNGDKLDNRIENLVILRNSHHAKEHGKWRQVFYKRIRELEKRLAKYEA